MIKRNTGVLYCLNKVESDLVPVSQRIVPPPVETLDHPTAICLLAKELKGEREKFRYFELGIKDEKEKFRYLELGVRNSPVIDKMKLIATETHGVDINDCGKGKFDTFHQMTTDKYFEDSLFDDKFDMIFVDACHNIENVIKDFNNAFCSIRSGGIILLHDTYPHSEAYINPRLCSTAYQVGPHIRDKYAKKNLVTYVTLPFQPGLTVVRKT
uniref:Methyltransferase domain protein n=1 Tax=Pithovirus LCPAC404 TaxID=2506597 RepID=A0A481ZCI0_9VIRU|nr:MAG: methyltransferase domain protein [Pithovirus LCPAC404]